MKLYEWQAKELIKEFLQVPNSTKDPLKFKEFIEKYDKVVCKTQVLFGSRAKKGLIKFAEQNNIHYINKEHHVTILYTENNIELHLREIQGQEYLLGYRENKLLCYILVNCNKSKKKYTLGLRETVSN